MLFLKGAFSSKKDLFIFLLLILATVFLSNIIFSQQLSYGFRDQDWEMLYHFKNAGELSPRHLLESIKVQGIYIYEIYYVGLLEKFLGLNYVRLHLASHIFLMITAVFLYLLITKIFKNRLLAFITSLIYTVSYTHAGVLFQLATGGYFISTIFMSLFLLAYYYSLTSRKIRMSILSSVLLITTLILNPERMYPLIAFVILLEFSLIAIKKFNKEFITISLRRAATIILPLLFFYLIYLILAKSFLPIGRSPGQFQVGFNLRVNSIMQGNWQLLLYPFASLGSIFFHREFWKLFGELNFQTFPKFTLSLISGPILKLAVITFLLFSCLFRKSLKLGMIVLSLTFLFGLIIYYLFIHWQSIDPLVRIHFDPNFLTMPSLFGFYVFILSLILFFKWRINNDSRLVPLILGPFFTYIFIFFTWLPSDIQLAFLGTQRYLSIPAFGTSLFLGGVLIIIYDRLKQIKLIKQFAWVTFLLMVPLIVVNYQIANQFFKDELTSAGLRATDQVRLQNKFREMIKHISFQERSLFYFDESYDHDNGYFDESTIEAGFEYWTRINSDGTFNNFPTPAMIRTNIQCPEHTHQNCIDILKKGLAKENGEKGIWYKDPYRDQKSPYFYKLSDFYAVRFINKDFVDIRKEAIMELNGNTNF